MNLYIRYFDDETLVYSVEEALHFLSSLDDVEVTEEMSAELEKFMASSALYPKHIKVRARSFFIVIKTTAQTMEEFKAKGAASQGKEEKAAQKEAERVQKARMKAQKKAAKKKKKAAKPASDRTAHSATYMKKHKGD